MIEIVWILRKVEQSWLIENLRRTQMTYNDRNCISSKELWRNLTLQEGGDTLKWYIMIGIVWVLRKVEQTWLVGRSRCDYWLLILRKIEGIRLVGSPRHGYWFFTSTRIFEKYFSKHTPLCKLGSKTKFFKLSRILTSGYEK